MKKIGISLIFTMLFCSTVSAYNPPINGETFFEYASPKLLSGTLSTAGGGIFTMSPESIVLNPAITAKEQRTDLNVAYTALISGNEVSQLQKKAYGNIIQSSILIPSKLYIFTGLVNFTSAYFDEMELGSSLNVKANLSKEITEGLDVGLGLNAGFLFTADFDWSLSANIGALVRLGDLGFLKDFRIGASINNLGKVYTNAASIRPVNVYNATSPFPSFCYIRTGAAALFVSTDVLKLGMSLDLETPCFQNLLISTALNFSVKDQLFITIQEKINIYELANMYAQFIPSVGISYKFRFNVNNAYLEKNDWSESEMRVSTAYKNAYDTVNAISADVDITLGLKDETPPVIQLWEE
ncbi:MAG: hypothetical protein J6C25_02465 [Treponema sp.]|nr:hypothetical protein [Treponema sp.]